MQIIKTIQEFKSLRKKLNNNIGFVPTMGALHIAHESLIQRAVDENDISVVSIYVNPAQFNNSKDFDSYPNTLENDIKVCEKLGVDYLFLPSSDEMYYIDEVLIKAPEGTGSMLEGACRPGHFDGVLRVILKFFNIIQPTKAYFGQKDAQQLFLINMMVKNLFLDIDVVGCDLIREPSGLAYSSRNINLSAKAKEKASLIYKIFLDIKQKISHGIIDVEKLKTEALEQFDDMFEVEYLEIYTRDFHKISQVEVGNSLVMISVYIDDVRLIDNILV